MSVDAVVPDIKTWLPEFKVSAEADIGLLSYFVKTPYLFQIILEDRWLVLGRKGTGKTSIFEFLKQHGKIFSNTSSTVALNFKDYPWPVHKLYKEDMEGELTAYQKSWHYLFITQALADMIKSREANGGPVDGDLKAAKRVLEKIYGNPFPSLLESVRSKLFRLDKISLPSIETEAFSANIAELSFEELAKDKNLQTRLRTNSFAVCEYFERILIKHAGSHQTVLLLDHLDENWLPEQLQEYAKILINLLAVASSINSNSKFRGKLKVVLFLRSDIFDSLQFNDKNKLSQDGAIHIVWDRNALDEMFFERIKLYCPVGVKLDSSLKSSSVFEVKKVRQGNTPFAHILKRTFYRPRDVIVYFNKLRIIHKKNNSGLFTSKNLYEAEQLVSEHLYAELIDEWLVQRPELSDMLAILQAIGFEVFEYRDFAQKYVKLRPGTRVDQIHEALRFLYSNSLIGLKVGSTWEYSCTKPYMSFDIDKQFKVAAGLKIRLNLSEKRTSKKNGHVTLKSKEL